MWLIFCYFFWKIEGSERRFDINQSDNLLTRYWSIRRLFDETSIISIHPFAQHTRRWTTQTHNRNPEMWADLSNTTAFNVKKKVVRDHSHITSAWARFSWFKNPSLCLNLQVYTVHGYNTQIIFTTCYLKLHFVDADVICERSLTLPDGSSFPFLVLEIEDVALWDG